MSVNLPHLKTVAFLVYDGIQILDVTGPAAVFGAANDGLDQPFYDVRIVSQHGGLVQSNSAPAIASEALAVLAAEQVDTLLLVGGGSQLESLVSQPDVAEWIYRVVRSGRRYGSICTGAFGLARLGLADGKTVATHWNSSESLATRYPKVTVDAQSLYRNDGRMWTSAGVSTGIDMSLAMVGEDLGQEVTSQIAKRLVLYAKRPGNQAQFSEVLVAQSRAGSVFGELVEWIRTHLAEPMDTAVLAERMAMSERNFHRKFTAVMRQTPANLVESLRLEMAQHLLRAGRPIKFVAAEVGYRSAEQFARAFVRRLGLAPTVYQELHASPG